MRHMADTTRLVTASELARYPRDDGRYELVEGRLIRMSPTGWEHGTIVMQIGSLLDRHVRAARLGAVVTEVGFTLRSDPDTVRAPDIAFVAQDRLPTSRVTGFWPGPPDLAVEVLSPDDRPSDVLLKVEEYLTAGSVAVVVVAPDKQSITTYRRLSPPVTVGPDEELDLDDIVAGFRCAAGDVLHG